MQWSAWRNQDPWEQLGVLDESRNLGTMETAGQVWSTTAAPWCGPLCGSEYEALGHGEIPLPSFLQTEVTDQQYLFREPGWRWVTCAAYPLGPGLGRQGCHEFLNPPWLWSGGEHESRSSHRCWAESPRIGISR